MEDKIKIHENIIVKCEEHLQDVIRFATMTGQIDKLQVQLDRLAAWTVGPCVVDGWKIYLYSDFAPYSFFFNEYNLGLDKKGLSGGLIYHGAHDRGGDGGAPTFSVNLSPVDGWAIHT